MQYEKPLTPALPMNRVAQSVPAASCGSVPLPARMPGGTPGALAGEDACATSPPVRFKGSLREIAFRRILSPSDGEREKISSVSSQSLNGEAPGGRPSDSLSPSD